MRSAPGWFPSRAPAGTSALMAPGLKMTWTLYTTGGRERIERHAVYVDEVGAVGVILRGGCEIRADAKSALPSLASLIWDAPCTGKAYHGRDAKAASPATSSTWPAATPHSGRLTCSPKRSVTHARPQ